MYARVRRALDSWPGYKSLSRVAESFSDVQIYVAGGVVRDIILGRQSDPKDFDFFVDGPSVPQALAALADAGQMDTGPFGSGRWTPAGASRVYCDVIPISRFSNGLWRCEDFTDALNQFDFTGNAVGFDVRGGRFFDPQNGRRDLERRIMRAVRFDYPDEPIVPGHALSRLTVLWFRILHYARVLELTIEPVTLRWLADHSAFRVRRGAFATTFFEPHPESFLPLGG